MLGSVNDDHAMLDGLCNLLLGGPFQGHVGDEVGNLPHLNLGASFR